MVFQKCDGKKGMVAVQTLRNSQMVIIFTASIAIIFNVSLAAMTNNAYNATHGLFNFEFFGLVSGPTFALKYGTASVLLLFSFVCSSLAVGFLMDVIFLIDVSVEIPRAHAKKMLERGNALALVGNRLLCMALPMLLWMFGPLAVAVSSVALLWWFYELDFAGKIMEFRE